MLKLQAKLAATAIGLALMAAPAAHATTVFSDNFDSENGGATALNYTGFTKWTSTGGGFVDLVATPDYGIHCAGGGGSCVDLDGTPGPGQITTIDSFAVNTGDHVKLSFDVSGSQRSGDDDNFYTMFDFGAGGLLLGTVYGGGGYSFVFPTSTLVGTLTISSFINGNSPWTNYTVSFTAGNAGAFHIGFGSNSADNVGPLLDNVNLSVGGVPEPATWSMMIMGFGALGAALRRRRALAPVLAA